MCAPLRRFTATAKPRDDDANMRRFYVDHGGVIKFEIGADADTNSPVLGGSQ